MLYVIYNGRARLGNTAEIVMLCDIFDIGPGRNIRTKADTDNAVYAFFL